MEHREDDDKDATDETTAEPQGRARGGLARKDALSPERRLAISQKANAARWGRKRARPQKAAAPAKILKATHRGDFREHFNTDVECYVLDDEQKTAVISKRGMGAALGMYRTGSAVTDFLSGERVAKLGGGEVAAKLANPLKFNWDAAAAATGAPAPNALPAAPPPGLVHGYDVTILIDICKVILAANAAGVLQKRHQKMVGQASVIVSASAKHGITQLVYALAGYDATRAEQIAAFKDYVRKEAREYEKAFPNRLYEEWYRLYELPKLGRNRPWKFRTLTIDHVYKPLAKSNGKILELTRSQRSRNPKDRWKKLHQFLERIGLTALGLHLGELLGIAKRAKTLAEYEREVEETFGVKRKMIQGSLDL